MIFVQLTTPEPLVCMMHPSKETEITVGRLAFTNIGKASIEVDSTVKNSLDGMIPKIISEKHASSPS